MDEELSTLREQVSMLQRELEGERIVHQRLTDYVQKLLREYAELKKEFELLQEPDINGEEGKQ